MYDIRITEKDVRLFENDLGSYNLTDVDLYAVCNNYSITVSEAICKIADAHDISVESINIVFENQGGETIGSMNAKIEATKRSLKTEDYKPNPNVSRANLLKMQLKKQEEELERIKSEEEKDHGSTTKKYRAD
jgi:hypothetical protein